MKVGLGEETAAGGVQEREISLGEKISFSGTCQGAEAGSTWDSSPRGSLSATKSHACSYSAVPPKMASPLLSAAPNLEAMPSPREEK